jgi:hypothetical protein
MLSVLRIYSIDNRTINEYGAIGGMRTDRGNRSTWKKPSPVTLCPPQIPHDLGSNSGHCSEKPVTNCLSYGISKINKIIFFFTKLSIKIVVFLSMEWINL